MRGSEIGANPGFEPVCSARPRPAIFLSPNGWRDQDRRQGGDRGWIGWWGSTSARRSWILLRGQRAAVAVANGAAGVVELAAVARAGQPGVMEASGGYERLAHRLLTGHGSRPAWSTRCASASSPRLGPPGQDRPARCGGDRPLRHLSPQAGADLGPRRGARSTGRHLASLTQGVTQTTTYGQQLDPSALARAESSTPRPPPPPPPPPFFFSAMQDIIEGDPELHAKGRPARGHARCRTRAGRHAPRRAADLTRTGIASLVGLPRSPGQGLMRGRRVIHGGRKRSPSTWPSSPQPPRVRFARLPRPGRRANPTALVATMRKLLVTLNAIAKPTHLARQPPQREKRAHRTGA